MLHNSLMYIWNVQISPEEQIGGIQPLPFLGTRNEGLILVIEQRIPVSSATRGATGTIFFFKALAVCCAVHLAVMMPHITKMLIATDNTHTFYIFVSLSALPIYNPILLSTITVLLRLDHKLDLCIVYIKCHGRCLVPIQQ